MPNGRRWSRLEEVPDPSDTRAMASWMSVAAQALISIGDEIHRIGGRLERWETWQRQTDERLSTGAGKFRELEEDVSLLRDAISEAEQQRLDDYRAQAIGGDVDGDDQSTERALQDIRERGITWRDAFMLLMGIVGPLLVWLLTTGIPIILETAP